MMKEVKVSQRSGDWRVTVHVSHFSNVARAAHSFIEKVLMDLGTHTLLYKQNLVVLLMLLLVCTMRHAVACAARQESLGLNTAEQVGCGFVSHQMAAADRGLIVSGSLAVQSFSRQSPPRTCNVHEVRGWRQWCQFFLQKCMCTPLTSQSPCVAVHILVAGRRRSTLRLMQSLHHKFTTSYGPLS
jgi:hypothetical protein